MKGSGLHIPAVVTPCQSTTTSRDGCAGGGPLGNFDKATGLDVVIVAIDRNMARNQRVRSDSLDVLDDARGKILDRDLFLRRSSPTTRTTGARLQIQLVLMRAS